MSIIAANDPAAVASSGILRTDKPTTPVLSVVTGTNSATATIIGEAGCIHYLYYKNSDDSAWRDGGNRTGNGTLTVTGLSNNVPYLFVAISKNTPGIFSLPSIVVLLTLPEIAAAAASAFDELLTNTANDFLTEFGEPITYLPASGGGREITAIIDREPPAELDGMSQVYGSRLIIGVANRCVAYKGINGISSAEINISKDKAMLPVRIKETAVTKLITKIISQDAGMMKLEVR